MATKYNIKIERSVHHTIEDTIGVIGKIMLNDTHHATVYSSPTSNCQMFTIASFCNLLIIDNKDDFRGAIKEIWDVIGSKKILLLDVNVIYSKRVIEHFGLQNIIMHSDYTSTNESKMTIFLIKMYGVNSVSSW